MSSLLPVWHLIKETRSTEFPFLQIILFETNYWLIDVLCLRRSNRLDNCVLLGGNQSVNVLFTECLDFSTLHIVITDRIHQNGISTPGNMFEIHFDEGTEVRLQTLNIASNEVNLVMHLSSIFLSFWCMMDSWGNGRCQHVRHSELLDASRKWKGAPVIME